MYMCVQFIAADCELEVNIDVATRLSLVQRVRAGDGVSDVSVFDEMVVATEKQLVRDSLPRYLSSEAWKKAWASVGGKVPTCQPVQPGRPGTGVFFCHILLVIHPQHM